MQKKDREEMIEALTSTVERVVNGKIDRLAHRFEEHEQEFVKFREELQPAVDLMKGSLVARKVIIWFTSIIIAVGSAYLTIKGIIR